MRPCLPPLREKEKGLTERRRLVPRVCSSSSKNPGPVVLRGKTHGGEQDHSMPGTRATATATATATHTPAFEAEGTFLSSGLRSSGTKTKTKRNETCPRNANSERRGDDPRSEVSRGRAPISRGVQTPELARPANATSRLRCPSRARIFTRISLSSPYPRGENIDRFARSFP